VSDRDTLIRYALTAAANLQTPPSAWFSTQEPPGKMPLTVTDEGRVFGHIATWDSCHVGYAGCVSPPRSPTGYSKFHVCELDTDQGPVAVGKLMFSPQQGGHADGRADAKAAAAYYDRTGMAAAYLRAKDGDYGIWVCGSLNPSLSAEQRTAMRRELRLHPPSGDWRPTSVGGYELICALAVAVPGFPVPRPAPGLALIASAGVFEADEAALHAMEGEVAEFAAERRLRTLAARAQGIEALARLAG
jgi:hypothetical protein